MITKRQSYRLNIRALNEHVLLKTFDNIQDFPFPNLKPIFYLAYEIRVFMACEGGGGGGGWGLGIITHVTSTIYSISWLIHCSKILINKILRVKL